MGKVQAPKINTSGGKISQGRFQERASSFRGKKVISFLYSTDFFGAVTNFNSHFTHANETLFIIKIKMGGGGLSPKYPHPKTPSQVPNILAFTKYCVITENFACFLGWDEINLNKCFCCCYLTTKASCALNAMFWLTGLWPLANLIFFLFALGVWFVCLFSVLWLTSFRENLQKILLLRQNIYYI